MTTTIRILHRSRWRTVLVQFDDYGFYLIKDKYIERYTTMKNSCDINYAESCAYQFMARYDELTEEQKKNWEGARER